MAGLKLNSMDLPQLSKHMNGRYMQNQAMLSHAPSFLYRTDLIGDQKRHGIEAIHGLQQGRTHPLYNDHRAKV